MSAGGFAAVGGERVHGRAEQGVELGKLLSLVGLVVEHHEALELDLADRNVDLLDLWRGRLSFRKIELLIRDLPPGSRLWREVDPDAAEAASWGALEHLSALQIDLTGKANFQNWETLERPHQRVEKRQRAAALETALLAQRERQRLRELQRASG